MDQGVPYYVWLIAGLVLCGLETIVPGAFLIWIGLAGLIVGAVEYVAPMHLPVQALVFAALTVTLVFVGRKVYGSLALGARPLPLSRAHALLDRVFTLETAIVNGYGAMRVEDSVWRVGGEDMPAGTRVRVSSVEEGGSLRVEKA